jgi:pimeloyl-ACP methyl ester carboxylesterase
MVELPGLGGSSDVIVHEPYYQACAEAIEEVRQELGIEKWAMLAYSTGTRAAEAYIKRYPQSVSHAIFLCPTYILEIWAVFLRLLDAPHSPSLMQWVFSDWRLHSLVRTFGFNGQRHDYTYAWKNEIEIQPLDILVRSLCEMPGQGRTPFSVPSVPTLFIWGGRDALIARPRHLGPQDVVIPANHSAPMLAAPAVAEVVIPYVLEGRIVTVGKTRPKILRRSLRLNRGQKKLRFMKNRRILSFREKKTPQRRRFSLQKRKSSLQTQQRRFRKDY